MITLEFGAWTLFFATIPISLAILSIGLFLIFGLFKMKTLAEESFSRGKELARLQVRSEIFRYLETRVKLLETQKELAHSRIRACGKDPAGIADKATLWERHALLEWELKKVKADLEKHKREI